MKFCDSGIMLFRIATFFDSGIKFFCEQTISLAGAFGAATAGSAAV
ncbi:MAG: hypothetical protein V8T90_05385 [Victivallales bacterium]